MQITLISGHHYTLKSFGALSFVFEFRCHLTSTDYFFPSILNRYALLVTFLVAYISVTFGTEQKPEPEKVIFFLNVFALLGWYSIACLTSSPLQLANTLQITQSPICLPNLTKRTAAPVQNGEEESTLVNNVLAYFFYLLYRSAGTLFSSFKILFQCKNV